MRTTGSSLLFSDDVVVVASGPSAKLGRFGAECEEAQGEASDLKSISVPTLTFGHELWVRTNDKILDTDKLSSE